VNEAPHRKTAPKRFFQSKLDVPHGRRLCLSLVVLLLLLNQALASTNFTRFEHLTIEHGLVQNTVASIHQDQQGFVWMGTEGGLQRYDGSQFRLFRHDPDDDDSLRDNFVNAIAEEEEGLLWVGTRTGIHRLDPLSGTIERVPMDHSSDRPMGMVWDIHVDSEGVVWAATHEDAFRLGPNDRYFQRLEAGEGETIRPPFLAVAEDKQGRMVFGTATGLVRVEAESHDLIQWHETDEGDTLPKETMIATLKLDGKGRLWAGGGGVIFNIDASGQLNAFDSDHPLGQASRGGAIWDIDEDPDGGLWFASYGQGLLHFHPETMQLRQFHPDPSMPQSLAEPNLMAVHVDRSGLIWVGSHSQGAQRLNPRAIAFGHFGHHPTSEDSLPHPDVWNIEPASEETFWVATQNGLAGINWPEGEGVQKVVRRKPEGDEHPQHYAMALHKDPSGTLWVGSLNGLWRTDARLDENTEYEQVPLMDLLGLDGQDSQKMITSVEGDEEGNLFLTLDGKVVVRLAEPASGQEQWHILLEEEDHQFQNLHGIWVESGDQLWLAGEDSLVLYDLGTDTVSLRIGPPRTAMDEDEHHIDIRHGGINDLAMEGSDTLWLGGQLGLFRVELSSGEHLRFDSQNQLPADMVYSILMDKDEHIWAGTSQGLIRLKQGREAIEVFGVSDGLQSKEFNARAATRLPDGRMVYGGLNGINTFRPASIKTVSQPPPVQITSIQVGRDSLDYPERSLQDGKLRVAHDKDLLIFSFAALDFQNPAENRFRFKLEGFDSDWRDNEGQKQAVYTNIPAGEYRFKVQAANSMGVWNEEGAVMIVRVDGSPWRHPLALAAYSLVILLIAYLLARLEGRYRRREAVLEAERERRLWTERFHGITSQLAASLSAEQVVEGLLAQLNELVEADGVVVFLEKSAQFHALGMRGANDVNHALERVPALLERPVQRCRESGRVEALTNDELLAVGYPSGANAHAVMLPMRASGEQFGIMVIARQHAAFDHRERELLSAVATQAMMALENASLRIQIGELQ